MVCAPSTPTSSATARIHPGLNAAHKQSSKRRKRWRVPLSLTPARRAVRRAPATALPPRRGRTVSLDILPTNNIRRLDQPLALPSFDPRAIRESAGPTTCAAAMGISRGASSSRTLHERL
jgi:hypothetical protein